MTRLPAHIGGRHLALALALAGMLSVTAAPTATAIPYTFTPVAGSPFTLGGLLGLHQVLFNPNGSQLATLPIGGSVFVQSVSKSGAISGGTSAAGGAAECKRAKGAPLGGREESMAYSPNGALLAVALENSVPESGGSLRIYSTAGGTFKSDSCRSLPNATLVYPDRAEVAYSVAFSASGLLAVADAVTDTVTIYTVTSAGKAYPLEHTPLPGGAYPTGKEPDAVAFGPTKFGAEVLAVTNLVENSVSTFTVSGSTVAPSPDSPTPTGTAPSSVAISPAGVMAVTGPEAEAVSMYSVDFLGTPTLLGKPAVGGAPVSVAFDPTGTLLAVGGGAGGLPIFSVGSGGALSELANTPLKIGGGSVDFSPDGFLLAAASAGAESWSVYSYGDSLAVLPPWLTERIYRTLELVGLGLERARVLPLIANALEEIDLAAHPSAVVRLVSKSVLPGRLVGTRCVRASQGSARDPRCVRRTSVPVLTFTVHSRVGKLRVTARKRIEPGSHTLWVTAAAPGASATPAAAQIEVVG